MMHSVRSGKGSIINMDSSPTLSDGTAGGIEQGAVTLDLCTAYVDEFETVTEQEIADAMLMLMDTEHILVEGAAAVALACARKQADRWKGRCVVVLMCGANVGTGKLKSVFSGIDWI